MAKTYSKLLGQKKVAELYRADYLDRCAKQGITAGYDKEIRPAEKQDLFCPYCKQTVHDFNLILHAQRDCEMRLPYNFEATKAGFLKYRDKVGMALRLLDVEVAAEELEQTSRVSDSEEVLDDL